MSKDEEDVFKGYYPDLSDQEEQPEKNSGEKPLPNSEPQKYIKLNEGIEQPPKNPVFQAPQIFGGKKFFPPPPPPPSSASSGFKRPEPFSRQQQYFPRNDPRPFVPPNPKITSQNLASKSNEQYIRPERQRKNCIYVKNIPKNYNDNEKLRTFFQNQGQIKQIRINAEQNSASVRFTREEFAIKFINSKKQIFNRSFITYSLNENDTVSAQLIKERQNEDAGKLKKPIEVEIIHLREKVQTILAEKIRALLFLRKHIGQQSRNQSLNNQLAKAITEKSQISKHTFQQLTKLREEGNEYDWTITFRSKSSFESKDKRVMMADLQEKYGPVYELEIVTLDQRLGQKEAMQQSEVRIRFLGIKHSWEYYFFNKEKKPEDERSSISVEGARIRGLFEQGIIKQPTRQLPTAAKQLEKEKSEGDELVEVLANGSVRPLEQQRVIQTQLDEHLEQSGFKINQQ